MDEVDVVHLHGPFALGVAGLRLARRADAPVVASYHTPTEKYTDYLASKPPVSTGLRYLSRQYERRFLERVDYVLTPSEQTRRYLSDSIGLDTPIEVVPNGVDTDLFRPVDPSSFLDRHGVPTDRPLVGYTGRHGYEKNLTELIEAARELDVTLLFGGDGPARDDAEALAAEYDLDAHFLGFLDREEMPAFYSALDVFAFPSPAETQGLSALDAYACGTPVVGVNEGGLADTIHDDVTGFHYDLGDLDGFRDGIRRALAENDRLREACLDRRDEISVEASVDTLADVYQSVL